jgi:hypothetical protein
MKFTRPCYSALLRSSLVMAHLLGIAAPAYAMFVGVVEEVRVRTPSGEILHTNLRLGFVRQKTEWAPICESKPAYLPNDKGCAFTKPELEAKWQVFHRGSGIGEVKTRGWANLEFSPNTGLLHLVPQSPPRIGQRTGEYAGWSSTNTYRPLLAILGTTHEPTTSWAPDARNPELIDAIWPRFRTLVSQVPNCKFDDEGKPLGRARKVVKSDIELMSVYRNASGARLVGARVLRKISDQCHESSGFGSDVWFYLSVDKQIQIRELPGIEMKGWATSLVPVDFGDFDGDGNEEAIFWYSGYNADGYVLFYENFKRDVRFIWGYH